MESYERLLNWLKGVRTLAIICRQWGDTGKGKIVDLLGAIWAEVIVRGTGGGNAGHTIVINGKKYIMHIIPSGILHDKRGVVNVIGMGVAFDPGIVCEELDILESEGLPYNHLMISPNAKLVLPQHVVIDRIMEFDAGAGKIGTTGRGIAPVYSDHLNRIGLVVNDLLNPDLFLTKLRKNLEIKIRLLRTYDPQVVKKIMDHKFLGQGIYYSEKDFFNVDAIAEKYLSYGQRLNSMIRKIEDHGGFIDENLGKKNFLLEGAQGRLLSVYCGTYPFVTSSDCAVAGLAQGAGISEKQVDRVLGIIKAFYMTRVGEGPFPTEIGGAASDKWCNGPGANRTSELAKFPGANVNSADPVYQDSGIRMAGEEFGATTERPRRVGWLDIPLLIEGAGKSGPNVILTKLDVLNQCETIRICHAYKYQGPSRRYGEDQIEPGTILRSAITGAEFLRHCQPIYEDFPGWLCDLKGVKSPNDLPEKFLNILRFVVDKAGIEPRILSIGPERDSNIYF